MTPLTVRTPADLKAVENLGAWWLEGAFRGH